MRKNPWLLLVGMLVGCVAVAACGGDSDDTSTGDDIEIADDGETGSVAGDTASDDDTGVTEAATDGGGGESAIGVPLPPSADAVSTNDGGPFSVVQFIVPLSEQEATISFYDDWTDGQADTYIRTEAESGGVTWQNDPEPGSDDFIIAVLSPLEGDDFITVTLTAGALE